MLKFATIRRTNEAQQGASLAGQWSPVPESVQQVESGHPSNENPIPSPLAGNQSWLSRHQSTHLVVSSSCSVSPASGPQTPSDCHLSTSKFSDTFTSPQSAPSSVFNTPSKINPNRLDEAQKTSKSSGTTKSPSSSNNNNKSTPESTIKIFAQTLSQEVEYVTLRVNTQTKSMQIVRSLLKKFRLKHRDPNLFYLTLERWIRKDGLKSKSVMLLGDDAAPMQLQQCCSSPPYNDIKFTLQMRAGALMKIHCSDVCPETCYKCVSLSTQTTVDETIELMLHCLNLHAPNGALSGSTNQQTQTNLVRHSNINHLRQASSPCGSLSDSSSSASTSSSSSGIDSDPTNAPKQLDSNSRASSITSISSSSNISSNSSLLTSDSITLGSATCPAVDLYCLVIECPDSNYQRVLESDEYLVDIYQNLIADCGGHQDKLTPAHETVTNKSFSSLPRLKRSSQRLNVSSDSEQIKTACLWKHKPDQWFVIKLKKRDTISPLQLGLIKTTNPHKQSMPLPPIPQSLSLQLNNANELKHIVSTAQIEVNTRPSSSLALLGSPVVKSSTSTLVTSNHHQRQQSLLCNSNNIGACNYDKPKLADESTREQRERSAGLKAGSLSNNNGFAANSESDSMASRVALPNISNHQRGGQVQIQLNLNPFVDDSQHHYGNLQQIHLHQKQMSAVCLGSRSSVVVDDRMPPPPASLIWLPSVRPRKRNLSNASSTFQQPSQTAARSNHQDSLKAKHSFASNRRRYDPIQLAKDLNELDMVDNDRDCSSLTNAEFTNGLGEQ